MTPQSICHVNDDELIKIIGSATKRLFFMSAGCSLIVAEAIIKKWSTLGVDNINIILDVDAEVYRLGYGELEALRLLETKAKEFVTTINHKDGIRIGLLISDDTILIFSPTPLLIEAGSTQKNQPNAIKLDTLPENIAEEIGLGENGIMDQLVGLIPVPTEKINEVADLLEKDPPLKFDIARRIRAFNARFEFVEFNLKNCSIKRKKISLPKDIILLTDNANVQNNLNAAYDLISEDSELADDKITKEKNDITKNSTVSLKGYGNAILRSNKTKFEDQVKKLEENLEIYQSSIENKLDAEIIKTKKELSTALFPTVKNNPPPRWNNRIGSPPTDNEVRAMLDDDLNGAFGAAKKYIQKMSIHKVFKGVTYELLNDEKFINVAKKAMPALDELYDERPVAPDIQKPRK